MSASIETLSFLTLVTGEFETLKHPSMSLCINRFTYAEKFVRLVA